MALDQLALKAEFKRLDRKKAEIEQQKADIEQQMAALRVLMGESPAAKFGTPPTGLREVIKGGLASGPLRPAEVILAVQKSGFKPGGKKTPLGTRIYNELHRMANDKIIERNQDTGEYELIAK